VHNIGNNNPVFVPEVVAFLEHEIGKPAIRELVPMQAGDVPETYADVSSLRAAVDFAPRTAIADGVGRFVRWFRTYHGL
jgi:UDP-glucuronate 4-epimerase